MGSFFAGCENITIYGGSFNDVNGNLTVVDHSRHTTNLSSNNTYTNNVVNAHNDNSTRISGSVVSEEMLSMHSRSPGYPEEDRTGLPPPQRPRCSPQQIPSTGGSVTNLDSFNVENTRINGVFNNNSQNYYRGGAPPDNRRPQHNGPNWMSGPDQGTIPSTSGPHGSGQFKGSVQVPFQAAFPQQMGFGGPPGPRTSVTGANVQQLDQDMGRDFEKWLKFTISQTQSKVAGISGGNYDPQAAHSSSSPKNVDGSDSMNTGMANLSLNDSQPQNPTHLSPPASFSRTKSDPQIGQRLTDQMGSSNPSTSNLSPYNNVVQQGSHSNPSLPVAPHTNEPGMLIFLSQPTETPSYGHNPNRSPPPASTSPFNFPPSSSGGPDFNTYYGDLTKYDHRVHHTNIDSFNEHNNTLQDSFNDNSFLSTGNRSASESNRKRGFPDADVPIDTRKKKNSGVRTPPNPNRMDEDPSSDESDEQTSTATGSTVDSSGKKKKAKKKWPFGRK